MKAVTLCLLFSSVSLLFVSIRAECGDAPKDSEEGDVKSWLKNIGCKIQKGAEDLGESAKPWVDKIGASAKDFGQNVAQKYDVIKHKLTEENVQSSTHYAPIIDAPTEKVPLAPLFGNDAASPQTLSGAITEETTTYPSIAKTPLSFDDRFLTRGTECPIGMVLNHKNECRPSV